MEKLFPSNRGNITESAACLIDKYSESEPSEQPDDEQDAHESVEDDDRIIKTLGGSDKFLLKLDCKKPGLYVRVCKKVKDKIEIYDFFVSSPNQDQSALFGIFITPAGAD